MAVPASGWESDLSLTLGLTASELRFAISFFLSVLVSWLWRFVPTAQGCFPQRLVDQQTYLQLNSAHRSAGRHFYAIVTGFCLIYYPFGSGCFHALVPSTITYAAMKFLRPQAASLAWIINFTYLIGW